MTTPRTPKQRFSVVARLWDKGDIDAALSEVEQMLETWPGNPHLLVLKATLGQLQDEPKYELGDLKQVLQLAIDLDPGSPEAAIELGYFLDNVEDAPGAALKPYADGVQAARRLLIEGLIGQAKAHQQLGQTDDFRRCVRELLYLTEADRAASRKKPAAPYLDRLNELLGEMATAH